MANNVDLPSLSSPSDNGSTGNNSTSFTTLFGVSNVVVSFSKGHLSFANINSNEKLSPLLPPPSPPRLSTSSSSILAIPSKSDVPSQEPNEQMEPQPVVVTFIEKPRGRPSGSKNKPKPTMEFLIPSTSILRERDDFLKPIVLIVPTGMDIVNAIINFGRDRDVSISVHHASGAISEVNICNPLSPLDDLSFRGQLYMFSFSGFYTKNLSPSPSNNAYSFFNIQLLIGRTPQVFGGPVGRKLIAAEPVQVMASIIKKHEYHKWVNPITNPNAQLVMKNAHVIHYDDIVSNAFGGITNNAVNHPDFSIRASTLSPMNVQPFVTSTDANMLYSNNPTN